MDTLSGKNEMLNHYQSANHSFPACHFSLPQQEELVFEGSSDNHRLVEGTIKALTSTLCHSTVEKSFYVYSHFEETNTLLRKTKKNAVLYFNALT